MYVCQEKRLVFDIRLVFAFARLDLDADEDPVFSTQITNCQCPMHVGIGKEDTGIQKNRKKLHTCLPISHKQGLRTSLNYKALYEKFICNFSDSRSMDKKINV